MKNYYQILGLERKANPDEIKRAYRKLSKKFHPDTNDGDKFFEQMFKEINEANEILSNPALRIRYDRDLDRFLNKTSSEQFDSRASNERAEKERGERTRAEKEKKERERAEKARTENDKAEKERAEKTRVEKEKAEKNRAEKVKADKVRYEKWQTEQEIFNKSGYKLLAILIAALFVIPILINYLNAPDSNVTLDPYVPSETLTLAKPLSMACFCYGSQDPLFDLSNCTNPKSLTRLGTNPEFGNSHGLTPKQFYEKLAIHYSTNSVDKAFLDRIYRHMGYANGWADAKPEQFSETEVPRGTIGHMGYSKLHKVACDRLDVEGKDLLAFRIKSADGCYLHFMKTSGSLFVFCLNKK